MEEEEIEDMPPPIFELFSRGFFLHTLLTQNRNHERDDIEEQMMMQAMNESMDSLHDSLFRPSMKIRLCVSPKIWRDNDEKCFICLEIITSGESVIQLPCQHVFHEACIRDVVSHQHGKCPLCRVSLPVSRSSTPEQKMISSPPLCDE
jgi:hypothetical protein